MAALCGTLAKLDIKKQRRLSRWLQRPVRPIRYKESNIPKLLLLMYSTATTIRFF